MSARLFIGHFIFFLLFLVALPIGQVVAGQDTTEIALDDTLAITQFDQDSTTSEIVRIPGSDVQFTLRRVPSGSFLFGSPPDEPGRSTAEGPQIEVEMTSFWIMQHEVTTDEYSLFRFLENDSDSTYAARAFDADAVTRPSPPYEDPYHGMGRARHPATGMTQWAAMQYARWLSEKTGQFFRLPTEAEWEYACRAGSTDAYGVTNEPDHVGDFAWYWDNSGEMTHVVGEKPSNAWGLHDMNGNVSEWTIGQYSVNFHEHLITVADRSGVVRDPWDKPDRMMPRTVKGGAFDDDPESLRCAARLRSSNDWKKRDPQIPKSRWWNTDSPFLGFRLVRPIDPPSPEKQAAFWRLNLGEE